MQMAAAEFKARCLALLDRVNKTGESITITKRGRVVARLVAAEDPEERPWMRLRGSGQFVGDPFAPVIDESEIEALR
jgi:prevent-host-death family protein